MPGTFYHSLPGLRSIFGDLFDSGDRRPVFANHQQHATGVTTMVSGITDAIPVFGVRYSEPTPLLTISFGSGMGAST